MPYSLLFGEEEEVCRDVGLFLGKGSDTIVSGFRSALQEDVGNTLEGRNLKN